MKKILIAVGIICAAIACKKSTEVKTEAPVKYYFKIAPISDDGSKNDTTVYKTRNVY